MVSVETVCSSEPKMGVAMAKDARMGYLGDSSEQMVGGEG